MSQSPRIGKKERSRVPEEVSYLISLVSEAGE